MRKNVFSSLGGIAAAVVLAGCAQAVPQDARVQAQTAPPQEVTQSATCSSQLYFDSVADIFAKYPAGPSLIIGTARFTGETREETEYGVEGANPLDLTYSKVAVSVDEVLAGELKPGEHYTAWMLGGSSPEGVVTRGMDGSVSLFGEGGRVLASVYDPGRKSAVFREQSDLKFQSTAIVDDSVLMSHAGCWIIDSEPKRVASLDGVFAFDPQAMRLAPIANNRSVATEASIGEMLSIDQLREEVSAAREGR